MNVVHDPTVPARPTAKPREQRRETTSARILDAAQQILEAEGLAGLTMQRLAAEVGFTVGASYRYFASKDELVAALQRRVLETLGADLAAALERFDARKPRAGMLTALTRVAIVARVYATLGTRRPTDARLLSLLMGEPRQVLPPELGRVNTEIALRVAGQALAPLAAARSERALGDGDDGERALVLWASLQGVAQTRKLERWGVPGLELDRLADALVRALLVGWGAEPARAREALARAVEIVPDDREGGDR